MPPKGSPELYQKAVELHKIAYKRPSWNGEKYKKKLGHMLQMVFGKSVWTFKDLSDGQLEVIINYAEAKIRKQKYHGQRN
jgi:hypothetical protein